MTTDPSLCDDFKNLFTKKLNILPTTNENKLNTLPISNENTDSIKKEVVDDKNNDVKILCVNNNNDKSYQTRLNLAKSIKKLEKYEHTQIYQIIKNEGEKFSKNRRGIFFDLLKFKQSTIDNLNKYILSTDAFRKKKQSLN